MKYIATDFNRTSILLIADSEPNFNKAVLNYFKKEHQNNMAIRKYRISERDLNIIQERMLQENIPFYSAAKLRKN